MAEICHKNDLKEWKSEMNRIYLNDNWLFTEKYTENLLADDVDTSAMQPVRLPHTVCEMPYNHFDEGCYQMVSGYRRVIAIEDEWRSGHLLLTFEGAAHEATVYINGQQAIRHFSGYTAFTVDMMPYLVEGCEQVVVVRLDSRETLNQPPFGFVIDYMTYGGIYRDVYLDVKETYYIEDIYAATPDVLCEEKTLKAEVTVNEWTEGLSIDARLDTWTELETEDEDTLQHWQFDEESVRFKVSCLTYMVQDALLWDVDMPNLYVLTVDLKKDGVVVDTKQVRIGFREAVFEADGFYLNGEKLKLRGLNRHQSWPYVGYAMPKAPQQLDADLLKYELGANMMRTSHYPQSQYFIDRCDEIGLLVFTEIPGWQHVGDTQWKKIAVRNVREMIMQYRNHPSIILWGVRINESQDDDAFYHKTNQLAHTLDVYRQTGGVRNFRSSHLYEDVYTFNDFVHAGDNQGCEPKAAVTSDMTKAYFVSEYNGHMYPTKPWDDEQHLVNQALRHAQVLNDIEANEDIAGGTAWCMFDYNTHQDFGSGDRICYHGVMDMFRNPKLAAAVYKSQSDWEPVLAVSSSMNIGEYPAGYLEKVYVFTNGDSVRLYKGDTFIREFWPDEETYGAMVHPPVIIDDFIGNQLVEAEGLDKRTAVKVKQLFMEIQANGQVMPASCAARLTALTKLCRMSRDDFWAMYRKYMCNWGSDAVVWRFEAVRDGEVIAQVVKTPSKEVMLRVTADRLQLEESNSYDVATVHVEAIDEYGNHLPYYQEPLMLETDGCIALIGPTVVSMKGGFAGTYVRTIGCKGSGSLTISGACGEAVIDFTVSL